MTEIIKRKNIITAVIASLAVGLLLVFFSSGTQKTEESENALSFDGDAYEEKLEKRLKYIISEIDGVGEVSVMITLEGSAVYSYATDTVKNTDSDGVGKKESTVVLSVNGSNKKDAVVSGYSLPNVKGAAIVCSSALTPALQARVIGVASSALGISTNKIYVTN